MQSSLTCGFMGKILTWICQSISLNRPFHRQHPAPVPESLWPHPQTAASVKHTLTHSFWRYIKWQLIG